MEPIRDYKLEEVLRSAVSDGCERRQARAATGALHPLHWRQLSQYALSHAINDYFALPSQARHPQLLPVLLERRWTNRCGAFDSLEHFAQIRQRLGSEMARLLEGRHSDEPLLRFEQWETHHPQLRRRLSMIFQLVMSAEVEDGCAADGSRLETADDLRNGQRYIVQKYVVDDSEELLRAFCHYTTVFCSSAFPRLPERIEIYSLLTGRCEVMHPVSNHLQQSVDYVRLALSLLPAEAPSREKSAEGAICWVN